MSTCRRFRAPARRVAQFANAAVEQSSFEHFDPGSPRFGIITFVASIHHMDFAAALHKARSLLIPEGELLIVGLAANKSMLDWVLSALATPFALAGSRWHRETRGIGIPVAQPQQSPAKFRRLRARYFPVCRSAEPCTTDISFGGATAPAEVPPRASPHLSASAVIEAKAQRS
jgi:hypothetical protein